MATGISALRRKAKKAAAEQYYKVFSELKAANADYKAPSNNKKQIVEDFGDDVSYGTKRLAMQADNAGRAINADEEYRTDLKRYNSRYEALKKQLSGQSVDRYMVESAPKLDAYEKKGTFGTAANNPVKNEMPKITGNLGSLISLKMAGKEAAKQRYYDTEEEAMQQAVSSMGEYNSSLDAKLGKNIEKDQMQKLLNTNSAMAGIGFNPKYTQEIIDKEKVSDPSVFLKKETLKPINVGYRQLTDMEAAYDEIAGLSEKAGKSPVNKQAENYAKATEQLKQKLKREQGNSGNRPSGLLASELAGNNLLPEVIRA